MLIIKTILSLREHIRTLHQENKCIALVPTMGNLHDGHIKLMDTAKTYADIVIVSIFVNSMQFDCVDDLKCYPRTLLEDCEKLEKHKIDFVFVPEESDIYPYDIDKSTYVEVPSISVLCENNQRVKHFRGVATIVSKLFNLIKPTLAFFGEKDYQQLMLIRKMVADMHYDIEIVSVPIVRTDDGLALSSRNSYLTTEQRKIAPNLYKIMNNIAENLTHKQCNLKRIVNFAEQTLIKKGFIMNSVQIRDADTLLELSGTSKRAVILMSSFLGKTRLIDSKIISFSNRNE